MKLISVSDLSHTTLLTYLAEKANNTPHNPHVESAQLNSTVNKH